MKKLVLALLSLFAIQVEAANWYVRPNGSTYGSANGTSWTNAWSGWSGIIWASVNAGDTIWVAGGTYTQQLIPNKGGTSDTARVTIARARADAAACTGAAGWSSAFDSTVTMSGGNGITFGTSANWVTLSGRTTAAGGGLGWLVSFVGTTQGAGIEFNGVSGNSHITCEYMELRGPGNITYSGDGRGIDDTPFTSVGDHTFSHMKIYDWETGIQLVGTDGPTLVEYVDMYDIMAINWAAHHPNGLITWSSPNGIFRYNIFRKGPGGNATGEGLFFEQSGGSTNWQVYGNRFYDITDTGWKPIEITSNTTNIKIYNNTFLNCTVVGAISQQATVTGAETKNNLTSSNTGLNPVGTASNNMQATSDSIFVNYAARDAHIVGTIGTNFPRDKGANLGTTPTWNIDPDGVTRGADGAWDIGAFEFATSGPDVTPPSVSSATILSAGNQLVVGFSEGVSFGAGGGTNGWNVSLNGGANTMTYASGSGTNSITFNLSRVAQAGESGTISYNPPGAGWADAAGNLLGTVSGTTISNSSTQGPPTLSSATINGNGNQIALLFSQSVQAGSGGSGGWALNVTPAATLGTVTGVGSNTLTYNLSRVVNAGESITLNYTQPGNGIESVSSGSDLASISNRAVTNNSTQGVTVTPTITLPAGPYFGTQTTTITSPDTASGAVIRYTTDGSTPSAASPAYSTPVSIATNQSLKAISIWSGHPNSAVASSDYEVVSWVSTGPAFKTFSVPQKTGTFTWNLSIAAPATGGDAVVGIGSAPISDFTQMACIIQFLGNTINARNGGSYTVGPAYSPGALYNFVATINVTAHTWSLTVTPAAGGTTATIVTNAAFRTEQNTASQLSFIGIEATTGQTTTSAMSFPSGASSARYIGIRGVPAAGGAVP